jgi:hypothetical protein
MTEEIKGLKDHAHFFAGFADVVTRRSDILTVKYDLTGCRTLYKVEAA